MEGIFGLIVAAVLILIAVFAFVANQYKRCPSNKIIVVYGKGTGNATSRCIHGGGVFVMNGVSSVAGVSPCGSVSCREAQPENKSSRQRNSAVILRCMGFLSASRIFVVRVIIAVSFGERKPLPAGTA